MSTIIGKIGHASTGKGELQNQVLTKDNYNINTLNPTVMLRPIDPIVAEKSARICEAACDNGNIGYSMDTNKRTTLYNEAKKVNFDPALIETISTRCYADCSSFMGLCAVGAGASVASGSASSHCGNIRSNLTAYNAYQKYTDADHLTKTDLLQRGDILVREFFDIGYKGRGRHTIMVLSNGSNIPSASIPEININTTVVKEREPLDDIIKLAISIETINTTGIRAIAKVTKMEDGVEKALEGTSALDSYKWTYKIESVNNTGTKAVSDKIKMSSSSSAFSINGLKQDTTYVLSIMASEIKGEATFHSQNIIFKTYTGDQRLDKNYYKIFSTGFKNDFFKTIKQAYVKIKTAFKHTILHERYE